MFYCVVYHISFSIHLSTDGHMSYLYSGAILNNAIMNTDACFGEHVFTSFGIHLGAELLDYIIMLC